MTNYNCDRTNIDDGITSFSLLPSDVSVGPYVILDPCCYLNYVPISLVTTLSGMEAYTSQEVTISGGCPPYKWEVSSAGLSFTSLYTTTPTNTLYYDGTVGNSAGAMTITDICSRQGSGDVTIEMPIALVEDEETSEPWALVFIANTADCYNDGDTTEITYTPSWAPVSVVVTNAGCSLTGLNPVNLTTPEDYDTTVSLSITMQAVGYKWANGSNVYGTAVMSVDACGCVPDTEMGWDSNISDDSVLPGDECTVAVSGTNGPFSWSVEGTDFSMENVETEGLTNTLIAGDDSCGIAKITVTGCDGTSTVGSVQSTEGNWQYCGSVSRSSCVQLSDTFEYVSYLGEYYRWQIRTWAAGLYMTCPRYAGQSLPDCDGITPPLSCDPDLKLCIVNLFKWGC